MKSVLKWALLGASIGVMAGALTDCAKAAEIYKHDDGRWTVDCHTDDDTQKFSYCSMTQEFIVHKSLVSKIDTERIRLSFILYSKFARVSMSGDWSAENEKVLPTQFLFDKESYNGQSKFYSYSEQGGMILSGPFHNVAGFMSEVMFSKNFIARIGKQSLGTFPLNGTSKAGELLLQVWTRFVGTTGGKNYTFGDSSGDKVDTF